MGVRSLLGITGGQLENSWTIPVFPSCSWAMRAVFLLSMRGFLMLGMGTNMMGCAPELSSFDCSPLEMVSTVSWRLLIKPGEISPQTISGDCLDRHGGDPVGLGLGAWMFMTFLHWAKTGF